MDNTCEDCKKTFDNAMQLEFHICLSGDPIEEATKQMQTLQIVWGSGEFEQAQTYTFKTEDEKNSFLSGVAEAIGWLDYKYVGEDLTEEEFKKIEQRGRDINEARKNT